MQATGPSASDHDSAPRTPAAMEGEPRPAGPQQDSSLHTVHWQSRVDVCSPLQLPQKLCGPCSSELGQPQSPGQGPHQSGWNQALGTYQQERHPPRSSPSPTPRRLTPQHGPAHLAGARFEQETPPDKILGAGQAQAPLDPPMGWHPGPSQHQAPALPRNFSNIEAGERRGRA